MWIEITNNGELDLRLILMLGASVKECEKSIGKFGSGLKYVFAQALRYNIPVYVCVGKNKYELNKKTVILRDKPFEQVFLGDVALNVSTDFGQHDWKDIWYIYREIRANAMDEKGFKEDMVSSVTPEEGKTKFYLPEEFLDYSDRFCDPKNFIWTSSTKNGQLFVNGVWAGCYSNLPFNMNYPWKLTETRILDMWTVCQDLIQLVLSMGTTEQILAFVTSGLINDYAFRFYQDETNFDRCVANLKKALNSKWDKWAFTSGDNEELTSAYVERGYKLFPTSHRCLIERKVASHDISVVELRILTDSESKMLLKIHHKISAVDGEGVCFPKIRITKYKKIKGAADKDEGIMYLTEDTMNDIRQHKVDGYVTYLHEYGHLKTDAGDFDQKFVDWFTMMCCKLIFNNELED